MSYETGTDSFLLDESVKVSATGAPDWEDMTLRQERHLNSLLARRNAIVLSLLFITGFLIKVLPIMQYARVGGDPFLHYKFAVALLDGRLSVPVQVNGASTVVDLYYPPLFHLISLGFFLAFPTVDPYAIMKVLAVTFDSLQVVPLYFIVKRVTHSSPSALLASYSLLSVRSDYQMLSWGGYANIAGLLFICALAYSVMADRPILSGIFTAAVALTHHLSFLLIATVLAAYYALVLYRKRTIPRTLVGITVGGAAAYLVFYRFAMFPIVDFYSKFSPTYNQSLYVTPYILEQVGVLLILSAMLGIGAFFAWSGCKSVEGRELLLIWAIVPVMLAYAYLFGAQWHGVRWIHFIPMPLTVWTGIGIGYLSTKRIVFLVFFVAFTIQLILTLQGYHLDILRNVAQP